jgi:hypothetical protein
MADWRDAAREEAMADATTVYRAHPTQAEIDDVLALRGSAAVGTLNEDGSIHLAYDDAWIPD